jgi:putative flippase GtrA
MAGAEIHSLLPIFRVATMRDRRTFLGLLHTLRRYLTVGVGSAITDLGLYAVLTHGVGMDPVIANLISRPCGGLFSFTMNKVWTFNRRELRGTSAQFIRICLVWLAAYALSESLIWFFTRQWHWGPLHAKIPAEIVTGVFSFLSLRFWTFRT